MNSSAHRLWEMPTATVSASSGMALAMPGLTTESASLTRPLGVVHPDQELAAVALHDGRVHLLDAGVEHPPEGLAGHHLGHDLAQERDARLTAACAVATWSWRMSTIRSATASATAGSLSVSVAASAKPSELAKVRQLQSETEASRVSSEPAIRSATPLRPRSSRRRAGVAPPVAGGTPADPYVTREPYPRWRSGVSDVALDGRSGTGEHDPCSSAGLAAHSAQSRQRPGMAKWPLSMTKPYSCSMVARRSSKISLGTTTSRPQRSQAR